MDGWGSGMDLKAGVEELWTGEDGTDGDGGVVSLGLEGGMGWMDSPDSAKLGIEVGRAGKAGAGGHEWTRGRTGNDETMKLLLPACVPVCLRASRRCAQLVGCLLA